MIRRGEAESNSIFETDKVLFHRDDSVSLGTVDSESCPANLFTVVKCAAYTIGDQIICYRAYN